MVVSPPASGRGSEGERKEQEEEQRKEEKRGDEGIVQGTGKYSSRAPTTHLSPFHSLTPSFFMGEAGLKGGLRGN